MNLKTKNKPNVIIGVNTMIKVVSFQLISHRNIRLPKNCKRFLIIMDKLSEQTELTVAISFPNLESSSPDLVLS